jgi:hypothetical protein
VAPGTVKVAGKAIGTAVTVISAPGDPPPAPAEEPKRQQ